MKIITLLTVSALAVTGPALLSSTGIPMLDDSGVAYAGKGNGGGNGGGNGSGGKGGGKSDGGGKDKATRGGNGSKKSTKSTRSSKSAKQKVSAKQALNNTLTKLGLKKRTAKSTKQKVVRASKPVQSKPKKPVAQKVAKAKPEVAPREKNLQAQLKGLNSLNRNANGFFNGKDPKLATLRDFVAASVLASGLAGDLALAEEGLAAKEQALGALLSELGVTNTELDGQRTELEGRREELLANEPAIDDPSRTEWEAEVASVDAGLGAISDVEGGLEAVADARDAVDQSADETDETALREAIAAAMNATGSKTITPEEVSPEVVDFVSDKLGVGDAHGFIDEGILREEEAGDDVAEDDTLIEEDDEEELADGDGSLPDATPLPLVPAASDNG